MIGIIAIYAILIAYQILRAYYSKHQFIDEDDGPGWTPAETKWHRAGLAMFLTLPALGACWVFKVPAPSPAYLIHATLISALVFDMSLNLFRGRGLFYVGSKEGKGFDAYVQQWKWVMYFIAISFSTLFIL